MAKASDALTKDLESILLQKLPSAVTEEDVEAIYGVRLPLQVVKTMTVTQMVALQLALKAAKGDMKAIQEVLDRTMGKAKQSVEVTGHVNHYTDFLDSCAKMDAIEGEVIDVEAVVKPEKPTTAEDYL